MHFLDIAQNYLKGHKELVEFGLKTIGGLAFIVGAAIGLRRYLFQLKWQRRQFAYDYAERIVENPDVKLAMMMIDWSTKTMAAEDAKRLGCSPFQWNAAMIAKALDDHDSRPNGVYSSEETAIRTVFDAFLARFDRLGDFVECGIIKIEDFPGSLSYYITIMNEKRLESVSAKLSQYMLRYGSPKARRLFGMLGAKDFGPTSPLKTPSRSRLADRFDGLLHKLRRP